jgi:hypothetical protein
MSFNVQDLLNYEMQFDAVDVGNSKGFYEAFTMFRFLSMVATVLCYWPYIFFGYVTFNLDKSF